MTRARTPLTLAALAGLAAAAHAQTLTWSNPAGGAASTAANWSPAQIPTAANPLLFSLNAAYNVSFSGAVPQSFSMLFSRGAVGLTMSGPHTTGAAVLGNANASSPTVNFSSGTWNAGQVTLGQVFGSSAALNLSGASTLLDCGDLSVADDTNLVCTLNVAGAARIAADTASVGGLNPIGQGRVVVSGQTRIFPVERSRLEVANSLDVGASGIGRLTVANGALVSCGDMDVARRITSGVPSDGAVTVGGLGLILPATLNLAGDLRIGRGTVASSNTGGGAMTVDDDGVVSVAGSTIIGGSGLGSGALTVNPGGSFTSHGLTFGASGSFTFSGGSVTVIGGPFTPADPTLVLSGPVPGAALTLDGVTNAPIFTAAAADEVAIAVGDAAPGVLTLRNGASLEAGRGKVFIGGKAGVASASGTVTLESGAVLDTHNGQISVGLDAPGTLSVRSGARVACAGLLVSPFNGAGDVLIEGAGSSLTSEGITFQNGASGIIRDGAAVTGIGSSFGFQLAIMTGSSVAFDHASAEFAQDVLVEGSLTFTQSTLRAAHFVHNVPVSASGAILARIQGSQPITAAGDLTLGDDSIDALSGTPINVGAFRVTTMDADDTVLGATTINGGILLASDHFLLPFGRTLSGTGTIVGGLSCFGSITATGADGLTIDGILIGVGQGVSGSKITFAPGGGFSGTGLINAKVVSQIGSVSQISGPTTFGDGSIGGFSGGGEMFIHGSLTLSDSNGVALGTLTDLNAATLICPSSITLNGAPVTAILRGSGTVTCPQLNNAGVIKPGIPGLDPSGQLSLTGAYNQFAGVVKGELQIDLEGPAASQADLLTVQGAAGLAGILRVTAFAGFHPVNGFSRSIVQAGSIVGRFDEEILPPRFHTEYSANQVRVVFCSADFNEDGFVDFFDYDDYVQCFETGLCPPGTDADFNEDGFADFFDYDDFVNAFQQGC